MASDNMRRRSSATDRPSSVDEPDALPLGAEKGTQASCKKCNFEVGKFINLFQRVSGTYYLPSLPGSYEFELRDDMSKPTRASPGTDLESCLIQPLLCPKCKDTLGFKVLEAPERKKHFRDREFFKLPRIRLTWETEGSKIEVKPFVDPSDSRTVVGAADPEGGRDDSVVPSKMEAHHERREHAQLYGNSENAKHTLPPIRSPPLGHSQHQPLQPIESNRQSLPPIGRSPSLPSNGIKSTVSHRASEPHDTHFAHPPPRESPGAMAHRSRELPMKSPTSVNDEFDFIKRLQAQISQSAAALQTQHRELNTLREEARSRDAALNQYMLHTNEHAKELRRLAMDNNRLSEEAQAARQHQAALSAEIYQLRTRPQGAAVGSVSVPTAGTEAALELMNNKLVETSRKVGEVDALKVTLELLRSRLERLEAPKVAAPPTAATVLTVPSSAAPPTAEGVVFHHHRPVSHVNTPDPFETTESASAPPPASGWATVNAGVKRPHVESPSVTPTVRSPKRPHLGDNPTPVPSTQPAQHHLYNANSREGSEPRPLAHTHSFPSTMPGTLPSKLTEPSAPQPTLQSQYSQSPGYPVYPIQDAPPDESWRPESQRKPTRGRPRKNRGAGKAITTGYHTPYATPEQTRPDWPGVVVSQGTPNTPVPGTDYYSEPRARGIVRRGGGGAGAAVPGHVITTDAAGQPFIVSPNITSTPGIAVTPSGVQYGFHADGTPIFVDPASAYGQPKKTRTKPVRDENGVLIRKDGRPDRRSQSSALNLRRVHEARELEKLERAAGSRPVTPGATADNGVPTAGLSDSVARRHLDVMKNIFPNGVEEARRENDLTQKAFGDKGDHTAHPRTQHHTPKRVGGQENGHAQGQGNEAAVAGEKKVVKKETVILDSQSPGPGEDVDMDRISDDGNKNNHGHGHTGEEQERHVSNSPSSSLSSIPPDDSPVPDRIRNPYGLGTMAESAH